jgi:general secretion pathway protein K
MALVAVLWVVSSAALLVATFNSMVRSGASLALSETRLTKIETLLEAGVEIAAARLIDTEERRRWPADGEPRTVTFAGTDITIAISEHDGLVDLNEAGGDLLLALFRKFAGSENDAARIRDGILRARGEARDETAETPLARNFRRGTLTRPSEPAAPAPTPHPAPFIDVAQLLGIQGMTEEAYRRAAPFLTVYNPSGRIDEEAAPAEVLEAMRERARADSLAARPVRGPGRETPPPREDRRTVAGAGGGKAFAQGGGMLYIVTVRIGQLGAPYHLGKEAIIATGLDKDAPYRLVAMRGLPQAR